MKTLRWILISFLLVGSLSAQVFQPAKVLSQGKFRVGINPLLMEESFAFYIHGGVGLGSRMDLGFKLGFGEGDAYFGADIDYGILIQQFSLTLGGGLHHCGVMGIDVTIKAGYDIPSSGVEIHGGFDFDINFHEGNSTSPLWFLLGLEWRVRSMIAVVLDVEIGVTEEAPNIFGGGINLYF
ncbi:MAG: hypothetical protein JW866_04365 [Ignavibacteriales bacterium]|nr:hypothetical protein [Ignavibacteriales bacterium]